MTHNAQRGHAHGSAPWSSGRAAAIVRKQPGAEHQPLALKQRRGRARRPAKIPCGRLFVRRRGRLDACCEPGGVLQNQPPPLLRPEGAFKGSGGACASEKATGHDGASSGPHWPELPRPGVDGRVLCWSAPGGVPSERLRRLALARSEHRRSARLGEASAWSPPGSRNAGQGGHRRPKTCSEWARGVFAVWQYCQNQAVARSGSARDVDLVWLVQ